LIHFCPVKERKIKYHNILVMFLQFRDKECSILEQDNFSGKLFLLLLARQFNPIPTASPLVEPQKFIGAGWH
jgi:hypothetical protein